MGRKTAEELLKKAPGILDKVDQAPIFQECAISEFPEFERSELTFGDVLGEGGYCQVMEVTDITPNQKNGTQPPPETNKHHSLQDSTVTLSDFFRLPAPGDSDEDEKTPLEERRNLMADRCLRLGYPRYAVKQLRRKGLSTKGKTRGRIDLALEVKYFAALNHPNIIKMRAKLKTNDPIDPFFFFLMDRLYDTLDKRMKDWAVQYKRSKGYKIYGTSCSLGKNKQGMNELLLDRMIVAYDLSTAFRYMHKHKVVYRDIKPENCGFDIRGNVKVFDFGLATSLLPNLKVRSGYNLTPMTGSLPYMAPEVAKGDAYSEKCDVFGFGVLLWEIISLRIAFENIHTQKEFFDLVVMNNERPEIKLKWPERARRVMAGAFHAWPNQRPNFEDISLLLKEDMKEASIEVDDGKDRDMLLNRSRHMAQQSMRSLRAMNSMASGENNNHGGGYRTNATTNGSPKKLGQYESSH